MINLYTLSGDVSSQKFIAQANIKYVELKDFLRFTAMSEEDFNISDDNESDEDSQYQRRTDPKRIEEIKNYIKKSILKEKKGLSLASIFPTALLLAGRFEQNKFAIHQSYEIDPCQFFPKNGKLYIVDGQHRLSAMGLLYDEVSKNSISSDDDKAVLDYLNEFVFNCTILINYDIWEQAKVFVDVNFTQKVVDKSLFYTIYGMHYSESFSDPRKNQIYIAHNLVKFVNECEESPLQGKIMMLGSKQSSNKGFVSQAYMVECLLKNIRSKRGIWYVNPEGSEAKTSFKYMAVELISFYTIVKSLFIKYWPSDSDSSSVLMKTTGMGAMLSLMAYLHKYKISDYSKQSLTSSDSYINNDYIAEIKPFLRKLEPYQYELFDPEQSAKTGGQGLIKKLFDRMKDIINDENVESQEEFIEQRIVNINGQDVEVQFFKAKDYYHFELSHIFQNSYQMEPYRPGGGSLAKDIPGLESRLQAYIGQVDSDAKCVENVYYRKHTNKGLDKGIDVSDKRTKLYDF